MGDEEDLERELSVLEGLRQEMSNVLDRVDSIVSQRAQTAAPDCERIGNFLIDRPGHRVLIDGQELQLTPKEFAMLSYLLAHSGRMVSHAELVEKVWGGGAGRKSVHVHIRWLREKLKGRVPFQIVNIYRGGYRLDRSSRQSPSVMPER